MSLTLFNSIGWAVEKQTIASGGGLTGPVLVSAVSTDPNTVRLTFDRRLMLEYRMWGVYRALTLDLASFSIIKVDDSSVLEVVRTIWINDTTIDLATANQQASTYELTCIAGGVMDFWGNVISEQSTTFTGQQKVDYTTPGAIRAFTSGYPGMQEDLVDEFYPDLAPPYLQNRSPAPGTDNVAPDAVVSLEIIDTGLGVDTSSVIIQFNGTTIWTGDTAQPGYTISKTTVTNGYRYSVTAHPDFASNIPINVHVYAKDLAVIYNELDTTYSFTTVDYAPPSFDTLYPTGSGVISTTHVSFSVKDMGGHGVDLSTVNVTIGGATAVSGGVPVGLWAGSSVTPNAFLGYDFDLVRSSQYDSYASYGVHAEAYDLEYPSPNFGYVDWTFRTADYLGPLIHPVYPTSGQLGAPGDTSVIVEVTDIEGIVSDTIEVQVNRGSGYTTAYKQGDVPAFKAGYNGPGSVVQTISNGYRITIDPTSDFVFGSTVSIAVIARDPSGNPERLG